MTMRVLIACEFSGTVRDAFINRGHDAISCDLIPSWRPGPHIEGDVRTHLSGWDLIIAFPPCTYLARSGASWHYGSSEMTSAIEFVKTLWQAPCGKLAIENPVGALSTKWKRPTQYVQPYEYGHTESKKTCLWLRGLPWLSPTNIVENLGNQTARKWGGADGEYGKRMRSLTYPGIAMAMANQWG